MAIEVAKKEGDYREGLPLGAIPSIAKLATDYDESRTWNFQYNADYYHHLKSIKRANSIPPKTYHSPPGRDLVFRFAASQHPGLIMIFAKNIKLQMVIWKA